MARAYHYVSCGLTIASAIAIAGLPLVASAEQPDLFVRVRDRALPPDVLGIERLRYVSPEHDVDGSPQLAVWTGSTGAHRFRYHDRTEFLIDRDATRIDVR